MSTTATANTDPDVNTRPLQIACTACLAGSGDGCINTLTGKPLPPGFFHGVRRLDTEQAAKGRISNATLLGGNHGNAAVESTWCGHRWSAQHSCVRDPGHVDRHVCLCHETARADAVATDVAVPDGAVRVYEWDDRGGVDPMQRYFVGPSWVVDRGGQPSIAVLVDGVQYLDGRVERALSIDDDALTIDQARQLAAAITAAADAIEAVER